MPKNIRPIRIKGVLFEYLGLRDFQGGKYRLWRCPYDLPWFQPIYLMYSFSMREWSFYKVRPDISEAYNRYSSRNLADLVRREQKPGGLLYRIEHYRHIGENSMEKIT